MCALSARLPGCKTDHREDIDVSSTDRWRNWRATKYLGFDPKNAFPCILGNDCTDVNSQNGMERRYGTSIFS